MILRDYQKSIYEQIISSNTDDLFQLDTGGGKTPIITKLAQRKTTVCVAHRNMLIEQISQTLTKNGANHCIIGNSLITRRCQLFQQRHYIEYSGNIWVGTIQSIISRYKLGRLNLDCEAVEQIIVDEAHHVANQNMWAKLKDIFPNARFIGATATPCRLDGQSMHKKDGGLFDQLVQAEQLTDNATQWLIANNYLSDYEYWCPPTDGIDFGLLRMSSGEEFTADSIEKAINKKVVAGSMLKHYKKLADGKRTLIYCPRIDNAEFIERAYKEKGYSATYIASSLSLVENMRRIDAFRAGEILILINVEMVTEGFDLPEIECVQMLRPTASFSLYKQMVGRNLRPKTNGNNAIFIDHVANVLKHGLPDDRIEWTLSGTPINKSEPVINCDNCGAIHNPYLKHCPECGQENWLRSIENEEDEPLIAADFIKVDLVRKVRQHFQQIEIEERKEKLRLEKEMKLKTEVQVPNFKYSSNAVGQLCSKLAHWFVLQLKDAGIDVPKINAFALGETPPLAFWSSNFTIRDLDTKNPEKCKQVFEQWQSR
ncbi:DEAD/DEAH box helicase [Acinetobacter ursingii]|uniref:DEAD/DEAH box helicase n=1 Tax=Acinetobacter ursingii TaxID=108980 RepID=UPI0021CDAC4D|nr:DEAD/DEAH box helicase [Acinetobacter ursingii]MCU4589072.1 DEAD/DEAH box helicase [Acinetobacter ursingii]